MPTLTHVRPPQTMKARNRRIGATVSELLIGPDGRVFAHNLTAPLARVLARLNPRDAAMRRRGHRQPPAK